MNSNKSAVESKVHVQISRVFAALLAGVLVGHFLTPAAAYFGYQLDARVGYLAGLVSGVVIWIVSRKVFEVLQETDDTMQVPTTPTVPAYLHDGGVPAAGKARKERLPGAKSAGETAAGTSAGTRQACPDETGSAGCCNLHNLKEDGEPDKAGYGVTIKQEPLPGGSVRLELAIKGLSTREFDVLRARLENEKKVPATDWNFTGNNAARDGTRRFQAVVKSGQSQHRALTAIAEITGRKI